MRGRRDGGRGRVLVMLLVEVEMYYENVSFGMGGVFEGIGA